MSQVFFNNVKTRRLCVEYFQRTRSSVSKKLLSLKRGDVYNTAVMTAIRPKMVKQKIGPTMLWTVELLGVVLLLAGSSGQRLLITVSEAWAKAEALDGKLVRVRGRGRFFTVPYQGLTGCVPGGGSAMVGQLALYDEGAPDPRYYGKKQPLPKIVLSESSLQCKGNTCYLKCTPFKPEEARLYEFVGTLRIGEQQGKRVLLLGDIDLDGSRRLVEEKWEAIKREEFDNFVFP